MEPKHSGNGNLRLSARPMEVIHVGDDYQVYPIGGNNDFMYLAILYDGTYKKEVMLEPGDCTFIKAHQCEISYTGFNSYAQFDLVFNAPRSVNIVRDEVKKRGER